MNPLIVVGGIVVFIGVAAVFIKTGNGEIFVDIVEAIVEIFGNKD
jgi:hypothetical protein